MQIFILVWVPAGVVLEHSTAARDAAWSHGVTSTSAARESRALSWRIYVEWNQRCPDWARVSCVPPAPNSCSYRAAVAPVQLLLVRTFLDRTAKARGQR